MQVIRAETNNWDLLAAKVHEERLHLVFDAFRGHAIEPILIKGWAAARNYPSHHLRQMGDIDIAVAPNEYDRAKVIWKDPELGRHNVDLHNGLRHLDSLSWDDLFGNSLLIDLNASQIRVLRPEDHLRVLCTHWLNDGGEYKEKLWDVYYAVANRPNEFDWSRCLDAVDQNRRRWVICAIALAHCYLGLEVDDLPFADELNHVPKWIINCIEKGWQQERLEPVLTTVRDRKHLFRQIGRRLPPNPIRATIEANGDLYGSRRWLYQAAVLVRRAGPFIRGSFSMLRNSLRNRAK